MIDKVLHRHAIKGRKISFTSHGSLFNWFLNKSLTTGVYEFKVGQPESVNS